MRTTIDLPDSLFREVKKRAVEEHTTMRVLIESCLQSYLHAKPAESSRKPKAKLKINWPTVDGGLPPGLDIQNREHMHAWLSKESTK